MANFFLPVLALFFVITTSNALVSKTFLDNDIVPTIVPTAPTENLKVVYEKTLAVAEGNELTPTQVKDIPYVEWKASDSEFYTLMMIDPDAPNAKEPIRRSWLHWAVVDIPGRDVNKGTTFAEYVGSGPPQGSGLHRYVFLVYKQKSKFEKIPKVIPATRGRGRPNFNPNDFAKEYNLGALVAGNFFKAQYDDYVPTIHKQISKNK